MSGWHIDVVALGFILALFITACGTALRDVERENDNG